jgi:putative spermidine/putrescine transport system ATP-binding protein
VGSVTAAGGTPHLVLDGLDAAYGGSLVVEDLTLEVARGELVALLGPSGCGKTTTLRMVAGFVTPRAGHILLDGKDLIRVPVHRRQIGVVFQSYALFPHLTVLENAAFGLRMRQQKRPERRQRAMAVLEMVGLAALAERYPAQLSGGQQQRVALARALVIEPSVLLLDEPLSNLDANLRGEMRGEIRDLQQRLKITTLFVTHDQQEALAMSDRVAAMSQGHLVEVGTPEALSTTPRHAFTAGFLGNRTVIEGRSEGGRFIAQGLVCDGAPDDARKLVLRAARLRLDAMPEGPLQVAGRVTATAFIGDAYETDVETPAGRIRVLVPAETPPPAAGAPCHIHALPGSTSFIA